MAHNRDYKPEDILFPNQIITESDIVGEMNKSMLEYAMSVIVDRALPDVRDGLKPVHRRILYTLYEDGLTVDKPFKKSATCVGDVLGRYHPHGDASVYDAMVRLAQDFSMRAMLVDGHGNFGSVDGDPPAAYRYTEARLSRIANKMLEDIDKETVSWNPNFDESRKEPRVLPSRFPNLLVNGSQGIAVGMTTSIPPHNLKEVINACICVLDKPEADLNDLMEHIQGPDFPTRGIIMGKAGMREAYATGRGKVTVRAKAEFEEYGKDSRTRIIVNELPYMVKKRALIKNIAELVKDKKIDGISDLRDETDRNGMRIVIELKRDANPQVVLNKLYTQTSLQSTFSIIMRALVDDQRQPKILTLRGILDEYLTFQKEVIRKRTQYDLRKAQERAHLLEGLIVAQDNIDEVIHIIRTAYDDAKEKLMARFGLDDVQAQAILDMRLKALQGLDREKLTEEYKALEVKIAYYKELLVNEEMLNGVLKTELSEIRDKFGDERRTEIVAVSGEVDAEDLIPREECVYTLTKLGYIKRMAAEDYQLQRRGGKGKLGIGRRDEDIIDMLLTASSHDRIMMFTTAGRAYVLKGYEIPETSRTAKGTNLVNLIQIQSDEKVTAMLKCGVEDMDKYIIMITKKGILKRTEVYNFRNMRKSGLIAVNLNEGDMLETVKMSEGEQDIIVASKKGQIIRFNEQGIRELGRTARGVKAMKFKYEDDEVVAMEVIHEGDGGKLLTVSETGFGRLSEYDEYPTQNRGGSGRINYHTEKYGEVADVRIVYPEDEDIILIADSGLTVRIDSETIRSGSRTGKGVVVMKMREGDKVNAITAVKKMPEEEAEAEDAEETAEGETEAPAEEIAAYESNDNSATEETDSEE